MLHHYWASPPVEDEGRSWSPHERTRVLQLLLSTDASKLAWGAHVHGKWASTQVEDHIHLTDTLDAPPPGLPQTFPQELRSLRGLLSRTQSQEHIHILEYEAVFRALLSLGPHV